MAKRCRYHSITCGVFGRTLYIAATPRQWRKMRADFGGALVEDPGMARTVTLIRENGTEPTFFVWVDRKHPETKNDPVTVVAHEAAHVAAFLLDEIGETAKTHEVHAYLTGWAARAIWATLHCRACS